MHLTTSKTRRVIFAPVLSFTRWVGRTNPELLVKIRYFVRFHKRLNLENPKSLNEKILYLSLRTDTTEWTRLADKHEVRDFVKERGLEDILIPEYAVYNNEKEIDFESLPTSFVMKTTHGCGDVVLCLDKSEINFDKTRAFFKEMLSHKYGELEGGKHYMRMTPRIIVEALIGNDEEASKLSTTLIDYKVWCFNGEPTFFWVCSNRHENSKECFIEVMLYDKEWNPVQDAQVYNERYHKGTIMPKPKNFEKMIEACRKLSSGFPCVRVDLYNINGNIFFGEMTFTSHGGLMYNYTDEFQNKAGSLIDLSGVKEIR